MSILIDGRPIRDPISGSAVFIIELVNSLNELKINPKLFLQGNQNKNKQLENFKFQKTVLSNGNKTIENIFYEIGFNSPKSYRKALKISHETYFGRLPFKADKSIATIHDVIPLDFPEWFTWKNSLFSKRNFRRQIKNADRCIFSSNYTKERVKHFGDIIGDYEVIPLAVSNYIHINAGSYLDFGKSSGLLSKVKPHSYVLAVGNIEPRKNLTLIAESIRKINKALSLDLDFVIAGHANFEAKKILEKVATKLGKNPIILGFVTNEQKIELYKHCACHVFASKYEGFGIPLIEAIHFNCNIILSDIKVFREITNNEGQFFDPNSPEDLSHKIIECLIDKSKFKINKRILEKYNINNITQSIINLY